jgi:hypothetical protein
MFLKMDDTEMRHAQDDNFLDCPEETWDEPTLEQALVNVSNGRHDLSPAHKIALIIFKAWNY